MSAFCLHNTDYFPITVYPVASYLFDCCLALIRNPSSHVERWSSCQGCHIWQLRPPCKQSRLASSSAIRWLPKPNFSSLKVPLPRVVIISPLCLLKQRAFDWTRVKSVIITWPADTAETVRRLTPANCLSAHIAQFFIFNGETWGGDFVGAFSLVSAARGGVKPLNENPLFSSIILKQAVHSAASASL